MGAETLRYAAVMLAAGIGIPILAALNAQLGARLGSPVAAGTVLFVVAFAAAATVTQTIVVYANSVDAGNGQKNQSITHPRSPWATGPSTRPAFPAGGPAVPHCGSP